MSGCATGYPKVDGELKRVYLANRDTRTPTYADERTPKTDDCLEQVVPTGYFGAFIILKDKVFLLPLTKQWVKNSKKSINKDDLIEWKLYSSAYQEALKEGITEYLCTDKKRTDKDILHKTEYLKCPIIRESYYTKKDKEFLEVFKNQVILSDYLEIPSKLGVKIYNDGLPTRKYLKEIIELAQPEPNRGICLAMPLKSRPDLVVEKKYTDILGHVFKVGGPSYATPGKFFKSYPSPEERKNMLKDKDPNIYWEYPAWGGFFAPDGKVNKDKLGNEPN